MNSRHLFLVLTVFASLVFAETPSADIVPGRCFLAELIFGILPTAGLISIAPGVFFFAASRLHDKRVFIAFTTVLSFVVFFVVAIVLISWVSVQIFVQADHLLTLFVSFIMALVLALGSSYFALKKFERSKAANSVPSPQLKLFGKLGIALVVIGILVILFSLLLPRSLIYGVCGY